MRGKAKNMGMLLLGCAACFFIVALCIYGYLVVTGKAFGFDAIWGLCLKGDRVARIYFMLAVVAFLFAVVGQIFLLVQHKEAKKNLARHAAAASNLSFQ